ncbi:ribosome silencing factor [Brevibacterium litoralis]|uniref:ribosome silencing factor n=1 Tax=Brevibacterium litoralis TaxID=3138935 RepID=UPI0032EDE170
MTATEETLALARSAALAASDLQGTEIVGLDVSDQLYVTEVFVVASASNERQVNAIVGEVEEKLFLEHEVKPVRREGRGGGRWVLLDFGDLVVHVFHQEDREFYQLESLWKDCPVVDLKLPAEPGEAAGTGEV